MVSIHAPRAGRDGRMRLTSVLRDRVSIHAPRAGRDRRLSQSRCSMLMFQSTRPARGATWPARCNPACMFQSTRPREARPSLALGRAAAHRFNPRARAGRDRATGRHAAVAFQSTRPREARRGLPRPDALVSIHAPARGATCRCSPCSRRRVVVSIHAPARGATRARRQCRQLDMFQSTRPREARPTSRICAAA